MRMSLLTKTQIIISRHTSKDLLLVINLLTFVQNMGTYAIDLRILDISGYKYGYLVGYVIRQKGVHSFGPIIIPEKIKFEGRE